MARASRGWTAFVLVLAGINVAVALAYVGVGRSWVERRYANSRSSHPIQQHIVIEGRDFVPVTDAALVTILCWELLLVLTLALLRHAARGRARGRSREWALLGASLVFLLSVGEACVRIHHKRAHGIPYLMPLNVFYDPVLGWKGKKVFGDPNARRPKVLVLGDSFTDGVGIPERAMYYARLKQYGVELFVYGGGGYGTLQELLVLETYVDDVRPDLVILQVCSNDFKNNSYAIESASYAGNNLMVRPYLEDGVVRYRYPKALGRSRPFLANVSRLAYELFIASDRLEFILMKKRFLPCVECGIAQGRERESFEASVRTTGLVLDRFRGRLGRTPLVAFPIDLGEPFLSAFARLFRERDVPFLDEPALAVASAEAQGRRLRLPDGGHLDAEGNRILGDALADALARLGYLRGL